jgi:gliding motility-associated-like protein
MSWIALFFGMLRLQFERMAKPFFKIITLCLIFTAGFYLQGATQPCPGGVTSESGNVRHWIKADSANCATHLCNVDTVKARVGANAILDPAGTGTIRRTFTGISTNSSLLINGKWLNIDVPASLGGNSTAFVVGKATGGSGPTVAKWSDENSFLGCDKTIAGASVNRFAITYDGGSIGYGEDVSVNSPQVEFANNSGVPFVAAVARSNGGSANGDRFALNGTINNFDDEAIDFDQFNRLMIGSQKAGGTPNLNGEVAEVIVYNSKLSAADMAEVTSYLAIRHGITLAIDYENLATTGKVYQLDGHFNSHIFGIAHENISRLHQTVSRSAQDTGLVLIYGGVTPNAAPPYAPMVNNTTLPSTLTNGQYLMIGDDNSSGTFNRIMGSGSTNNRIGRTFKVTDVGGVGTVTLWFKNITYSQLTAGQNYYLAYGADSAMGINETFLPMTLVPGTGSNDFYVQVDFPNGANTYFTITNSIPPTPAGVGKGLEFWVASDKRISGPTTSITGLRDISGNKHDLTLTGGTRAWAPPATQINYHAILQGGSLNRDWSTPAFIGQTIVSVGKAGGGNGNFDGWMGFNPDNGLREDASTANLQLQGAGNSNDWTNGTGLLKRNGSPDVANARIDSTVIILGQAAAQGGSQPFFLGGYNNNRRFGSYEFEEVLVYDRQLGAGQISNLETYLAIKYGITLGHNYTDKDSVSIYNTLGPPAYSSDIFGIGYSSNAALFQRQSTSINPKSIVTVSNGPIAAADSVLPLPSFGADNSYFITGNNGGSTSCFTTDELEVFGEVGQHVRVQREWKYQITGTWTSAQVLHFIMQSNNTNLTMPALPFGSTQYYIYVSNTPNFEAGLTKAYPMTAAGNLHTAMIASDLLPNTGNVGYFTFGTKLNTANITQTGCEASGTRVVIRRSHIADGACSVLTLSGGSNIYNFKNGASNTDSTYTVVNTAGASNCLDSLILILPPFVQADNYTISFDTAVAPCVANNHVSANNAEPLNDLLVITPSDSAEILWGLPGDSVFCLGSPNRAANMNGSTSGTFSFVSSNNGLVTNISQLVPNNVYGSPGFGTILVHPGLLGTHIIRYTTNAAPACTTSQTFSFRIANTTSTSFNYTGSPYCNGAGLQLPSSFSGPTGGTYSVFPAINPAALNTLNGEINVALIANPGNYVVTYTPLANSCASPSSTSITVAAALQANFQYLDTSFCSGTGTIGPFVTNRPSSGYFTIVGTSPMPLDSIALDTANGFIDLDSTAAGEYHIQYFVDTTACHRDTYDTITVHATPNTNFTVSAPYFDTLCTGGGMVKLLPAAGGGTFKNYDGHFVVTALGAQDSIRAIGAAGGPFTMYYVRTDPFCTDSTARSIYVRGPQSAVITYPGTVFCKNQPAQSPTFVSGSAGGTFQSLPPIGAGLDIYSGVITPSLCATGTYAISYKTSDPVCFTTIPIASITISNPPNAHFNLIESTVCQDTGLLLIDTIPSGMTNVFTVWDGGQLVPGAIVGNNSVLTTALAPGLTFEIQNIGTLGTCHDTTYDYLTTIARDSANIEFIPAIICVGDINPHPYNFGLGGGDYISLSGDIVNIDSGTVTVGIVQDSFVVQYTTPGVCWSRDTSTVRIAPFLSAGFSYPVYSWCISDTTNPTPTITNPSLGSFTWSSTPQGLHLEIDSTSGRIIVDSSDSGSFDIRYTIDQSGSCRADTVRSITIVAHDVTTSFALDPGPHCPSRGILKPVFGLGSDLSGIFVSGPDLVFAVVDSGYISLPQSATGQHIIFYTLPGECGDLLQDTITILRTDTSSFVYGNFQTAFCNDQLNVSPTLGAPTLPDSFAIPSSLNPLFPPPYIDPNTGEIDFKINNSLGNYIVYHYTQGICPDTSTIQITISNIPTGTGLRAVPQDTICVGESVEIKASGVAAEFVYYRGNSPDTVSVGPDHIFDDIVDYDTIRVTFRTTFGCQIADTIYIVANPVPSATLLPYPEIISSDVPFDLSLLSLSDETKFVWSLDSLLGSVDFSVTSGVTDLVDSSEIMVISLLPQLSSDINPASFVYIITPFAKGCRGDEQRLRVKVNPNGSDIFIPQVFTPNGNGLNETWQIQWRDGILPENYTIRLYNEAGALVYTMNPLISTWNAEGLADGVYWYILFDNTGEAKEAAGLTIRSK